MRILHLIEGLGWGGAERRLFNDVVRLNGRFSHTVAHLTGNGGMGELFDRHGIERIDLRARGWTDPRAVWRVRNLIRRIRPDLIHTQLFGADLHGRIAGRLERVPVLSTVQSSIYECSDPFFRSPARERLDRWTARRWTRHLVAVSEFVKESLVKRFDLSPERVTVIPNAVDPAPYQAATGEERAAIRRALETPADGPVFITVGRLDPPKGHRFALEALSRLKPSLGRWTWWVVGDGVSRPALERKVWQMGLESQVRFLGIRQDVPRLLAAGDLFLFPSVSEGLPVALLEGMAAGKPCVAFRTGPMPEVVEDGKTGLLAEPGSADAFGRAITVLLEDTALRERMGHAGQERVARHFHADGTARRLGVFYEACLG